MALTGDSIITRKLSVYEEPEFLEMIELIRSADVAFTKSYLTLSSTCTSWRRKRHVPSTSSHT